MQNTIKYFQPTTIWNHRTIMYVFGGHLHNKWKALLYFVKFHSVINVNVIYAHLHRSLKMLYYACEANRNTKCMYDTVP